MSRGIQLAFAAAQMAVAEAGIASAGIDAGSVRRGLRRRHDSGRARGTDRRAFAPACRRSNSNIGRWDEQAIGELYPLWMLKYLPNMPACHMAIALDARGPEQHDRARRGCRAWRPLAEAVRVIERGAADVMIVGGTGFADTSALLVFPRQRLALARGTMSRSECRGPSTPIATAWSTARARPPSCWRRRQHAEARGAQILARIAGFASGFEACTPGQAFEGTAIRAAIEQSLRAAQIGPEDWATSTPTA